MVGVTKEKQLYLYVKQDEVLVKYGGNYSWVVLSHCYENDTDKKTITCT